MSVAISTRPDPAPYPGETIPALAAVLDELVAREIRFCHWKSNEHLAAGLAGRTDLDILVAEEDAEAFRNVLRGHDALELVAPPVKRFPGMEHWLGFDANDGRLFHLHVHRRLVLGEQHVKNHHLPLERDFLDSARPVDGVPVPSPELELAVLAVRALLKYRERDVVKDVLRIRTPGLRGLEAELRWLLDRTDVARVRSTLRTTGDVVPSDVVVRFLEAYQRDPRAGATFFFLRRRLRRSLRRMRRGSQLRASTTRLIESVRRRVSPVPRMTLPVAPTVALVGADGSGKSTSTRALADWLGWKVDVRVHYLGSKSPSRRSRWSYVVFRGMRKGHRAAARRRGARSLTVRALAFGRDAALGVHHLAIGHDRARRVEAGRNDARGGRVVLFDRFPLTALSVREEHLILDGPRIRTTIRSTGRLLRALAAAEERVYEGFGMPDLLMVLEVSPEVASSRKPDHRPEVLAAKGRAARELADLSARSRTPTVRIDADQPADRVLLRLKRTLWDALGPSAVGPAPSSDDP